MAFTNAVTEGLESRLSNFYILDNQIYDECLEGQPAYANCLLSHWTPGKNGAVTSYFVPQGEVFERSKLNDLFKDDRLYDALFFEASIEGVPLFSMPGIGITKIQSAESLFGLSSLVKFESRNSYLFKEHILEGTLEKLVLYVVRGLSQSDSEAFKRLKSYFENERLIKMLCHIHESIQNEISLKQLGKMVRLSPFYVSQYFKRYLGMSVNTYIIEQRVKKGLYYLIATHQHVAEVSSKLGFVDQSYFNRRLKLLYGITPLKLRKKYQLLHISQAAVQLSV